jgi:NAD(P)-dependent dehydrogenase (short-subunit alcohol dehydrogenase family)
MLLNLFRMKSSSFAGKVAIVTGSSKGIGKAIAFELARKGAAVIINGRDSERLKRTMEEFPGHKEQVLDICCDVSTRAGCEQLISQTISRFGRIDILVNNVGVSMRGLAADLKYEVVKTVFETNVLGTFGPTIQALPHLRMSKGSIVFISSLAGIRGLPFTSVYCASKMALRAFAESIRIEEAGNNIHVGLILVGITEVEKDKTSIGSDGALISLRQRSGRGVQTMEYVARKVLQNISRRKFITILSSLGQVNYYTQSWFPAVSEWAIKMNINKFEEGFK